MEIGLTVSEHSAGEQSMLPTFIIAGASKSGTTSLWEYIKMHPEVCMADAKEPRFFTAVQGCGNNSDGRSPRRSGQYSKGLSWYSSLFAACEGVRAIGEASTVYMSANDAPDLIRRYIPDIRLIFILRDPVDRVYSHYWHDLQRGWTLPSFEKMVYKRHLALMRYIYISSYHLHLTRFLKIFPKDQVFVLLYDDLLAYPQDYMKEVYRFIGVDENFSPPNLGRRYNEYSITRLIWLQRILIRMTSVRWELTSQWRGYRRMARVGRLLVRLNGAAGSYPPLPNDLRRALIKEFEKTIEYVETYLQRDLLRWKMSV